MGMFDIDINDPFEEKKKSKRTKRKKLSRSVEKAIFQKYNGKCAICDKKTAFDYGEVDHIRSLKKGGSATAPSNLQWLCHRCNKLKGANKTNAQVKKLLGTKKTIESKRTKRKTTRRKKKKNPWEIDFKPPKFDF